MFWKSMSAQDIETLVERAVEKATAKSDETLKEERKRSNYIKASHSGQFKTRAGIFEYFRAYEGMDAKEALEATDLECMGRGIGEDGKAPDSEEKPTMMKQIQDEAMGFVLNSLKSDPLGTLTTASQMVGGVATFGAGLIGGKAIADKQDEQQPTPIVQQDLPTEVVSSDDI